MKARDDVSLGVVAELELQADLDRAEYAYRELEDLADAIADKAGLERAGSWRTDPPATSTPETPSIPATPERNDPRHP